MPLDTEVDLGPCHVVLHGDPIPPTQKRAQQPALFGSCLLWPNGRPSQLLLISCVDYTSKSVCDLLGIIFSIGYVVFMLT